MLCNCQRNHGSTPLVQSRCTKEQPYVRANKNLLQKILVTRNKLLVADSQMDYTGVQFCLKRRLLANTQCSLILSWGQDNQLGGYSTGSQVADLIKSHANKWPCDTFQPGAFIEEILKNRNALPTELAGQVEFGVCKITIALLLVATKPGRSELVIFTDRELTRHLETRCSSPAAIDTLLCSFFLIIFCMMKP